MLKKIWNHLEEIILLPTLAFTVGLIFFQVIMRYVLGNSLSWSEELARYLFVWQLWLGASYAAKTQSHLRITMLRDKLKPSTQRILDIFVTVIWIAFAAVVAFNGFQLAFTIGSYGQQSTALRIPMILPYLSVPIGCSLMIIRLLENILRKKGVASS